jgi:hypothetical protein
MCDFFRHVLFMSFILLSAHVAIAQFDDTENPKPFVGGLSGGINLAQVDGDRYFGFNKPGVSAGGFVRINFTTRWSACLEFLYSQKGSRGDAYIESSYFGTYVARCHIGLNYIEVPVTLQLRNKFFNSEAGLSYARLVKTSEWIVVQPSVPINEVTNRFNTSDFNYVFGISRRVHKHILVNARYQYSIASIRPSDRIPQGYGYGSRGQFNNLVSLRLLYEFQ